VNAFARAARGSFVAAALAVVGLGGSIAAVQAQPNAPPAADFGVPPSGEVPILFNDHHVYAKPDHLKAGRILVAIVRKNTILVPLRSMFEQTGAAVSYDSSTRTVDVSKPGADVKVTVGKAWVVINGQERPLDVPPEIYRGDVVVPLRVISEGMGAYVQWLPDKHLVVVRYVEAEPPEIPQTPQPTPRATAVPTATPPPATPTPAPKKSFEHYVAADYIVAPKIYNELSPGDTGKKSFAVKGAVEFPLFGPTWEISADYRHFLYPHNSNLAVGPASAGTACPASDPGCVTLVGAAKGVAQTGLGQTYVTAFTAQESDLDAHFGLEVLSPHVYLAVGGLYKNYNYLGYPNVRGIGFGLEKLPDLDGKFSLYGSAFYYPHISGKYTYPGSSTFGVLGGQQATLAYSEWKYAIGATIALGKTLYLDLGYLGQRDYAKPDAPTNTSTSGPYVGLGLHF
jgi:hypothetical protein